MPPKEPLRNALNFEKKNKDMLKLPKRPSTPIPCRIQKRPIPHAPIASPYAGSSVPKVVYISSNTPFMSAVKRVQKFLQQAEKRATASVNLSSSKKRDRERLAEIARGNESLKKEESLLRRRGGRLRRRCGVLVVDDVVEDEERKRKLEEKVNGGAPQGSESAAKKQRRAASALAVAEEEELPETRTRWVNKVEVSIAFK
ncbi:hypothetical protein AARAC_007021 [Aspergillus arachidicola]|uniref:Uncharacterized protein n=1 Tax=Aspergillus arachidicola TaxID=656916 RepID=A0A2G7G7K4_9EURO|nr:hypothetical protein AARAC_007021 [Aspergillus arachidicola]